MAQVSRTLPVTPELDEHVLWRDFVEPDLRA
jgi:hypothetical protein